MYMSLFAVYLLSKGKTLFCWGVGLGIAGGSMNVTELLMFTLPVMATGTIMMLAGTILTLATGKRKKMPF